MQIELYQTLVDDAGIPKDKAERIVRALEAEMDKRVDYGVNAIRGDIASLAGTMVGVRAELGEVKTSVKAEVRIVEEKVGNLRWYIGAVVTVAAIALSVVMHFVK